MGKYDALFADDGAKPGGKYAALFDEPAKGAKPFPWEEEAAQEDRIGRANRAYADNAATAAGPNGVALLPLPGAPLPPTGVVDNLKQMGRTMAGGVKAIGGIAAHPSTLADPSTRRELERGVSDAVTAGLAERAARAVDPEAFGPETAAADAAAAPGVRAGGGIAGSFLPSPAKFLAGKVGGLVPGTGVLPGAARAVAQYEATAPLSAAIQAEPGHGLDAAAAAATDPAGLVLSAGMGAAGGAISRAPERVQERGLESVARGEAGGTANARIARKATAKAGEGGDNLYDAIGGDLRTEAAVSVLGKSHPQVAAKALSRRLDSLTSKTEPFYEAIDNAPDPRFANPKTAPKNGGVDLDLVQKRLEASRDTALKEGRAFVADAYDKALAKLRASYGTDGKIIGGEKLPARAVRNYANELGKSLFTGQEDPPLRQLAQQQIYRDVVGAIEDEGKRVGVDMTELRSLNKKISTIIPARDAFADRARRASEGHTTLGNLAMSASLIGGGGAAGGLEGMLTGAALDTARRIGMPAARAADFALAKLVQASRAGAKPAQLGQMAIQLGISREVADRIADDGIGVLSDFGKRLLHGPGARDEGGPTEPGNIDLKNRPRVKNADGSISTVRSMGVNIDGQEVLIPTVSEDGRIMTDDEAVEQYKRTGRHLGKFRTPEDSTAYAKRLHEDQARLIGEEP